MTDEATMRHLYEVEQLRRLSLDSVWKLGLIVKAEDDTEAAREARKALEVLHGEIEKLLTAKGCPLY